MSSAFDDDEAARLRVALARIARQLNRQVPNDGLNRSQLSVLGTTVRLGPLGIGRLADIEGINPTMLSRIVGKLDTAGLIRRIPDPDDGRAATVEATTAGTELHSRLRAERTRLLVDRIARLPADRSAALLSALPAIEALAEELQPATSGQVPS
jgi:DNA-binding MarR family transcriptional regulator